jgi:hypothetical protein
MSAARASIQLPVVPRRQQQVQDQRRCAWPRSNRRNQNIELRVMERQIYITMPLFCGQQAAGRSLG